MRRTTLFIALLAGSASALCQAPEKSAVIGVWPSKLTRVDGLMFNFFPKFAEDSAAFPKISGVELNLSPVGLILIPMLLFHTLDPETHRPFDRSLEWHKTINGMEIGFTNLEPSRINGLDISLGGSFETNTNGLTCSLVMNKHHVINGVTIAAVGNHDQVCRGVQIGLFNSCRSLRGLQFGLWNTNERRSLPLVNWNFKKPT